MLNKKLMPRPKRRTAEPAPPPEQQIEVQGDHITLGQLLKVAGIIGTGGEAKLYLADIAVLVNGQPEQRRGRKLRAGDLIAAPDAPPIRLIAPPDAVQNTPDQQPGDDPLPPHVKNKPGGDVNADANARVNLATPLVSAQAAPHDTRKEAQP